MIKNYSFKLPFDLIDEIRNTVPNENETVSTFLQHLGIPESYTACDVIWGLIPIVEYKLNPDGPQWFEWPEAFYKKDWKLFEEIQKKSKPFRITDMSDTQRKEAEIVA